jgi:hypothetical protein
MVITTLHQMSRYLSALVEAFLEHYERSGLSGRAAI